MTPIVVLILTAFFASGFAALLYQVIWQRLLGVFSGADVYSATVIVAAFVVGLGTDNLAGGIVADRISRRASLLLFALAETAVGLFGLLSAWLYYGVLYEQLATATGADFQGRKTVFVNGVGQSVLPYGDIHTALGALPVLLHPNPREVAIIGLGSGDTVYAAAGRPETTRVTCIEIIGAQLATLRELDARNTYPGLAALLRDPRITHLAADGRAFLLRSRSTFDVIEADALRPTSAYSGNLYSEAYFRLVKDRLTPNGLAATWAPTAASTIRFSRSSRT